MISHGLPPRDNDVQRALADLQRQINAMHGALVQATNTANMAAATANNALEQMGRFSFYGYNFTPAPSATSASQAINSTVTVPAGFSRAAFFGSCALSCTNNTASADDLQPVMNVGPAGGPFVAPTGTISTNVSAGRKGAVTQAISGTLTGLTGGQTIDVIAWAETLSGTWTGQAVAVFEILFIWQV
jgi:hypothetical protein